MSAAGLVAQVIALAVPEVEGGRDNRVPSHDDERRARVGRGTGTGDRARIAWTTE
jgi:hypothetical protein